MDDSGSIPASSPLYTLRASRTNSAHVDRTGMPDIVDGAMAIKGHPGKLLRQSALPAGSKAAQQITTMDNADIGVLIHAVSAVIRAYVKESIQKSPAAQVRNMPNYSKHHSAW